MKICCISDTHSDHDRLKNLPGQADVVIHSGDCTHEGKIGEYENFLSWYSELPYENKILTPGNHDFICEQQPGLAKQLAEEKGIIYLMDSECEIGGKKFYGSPWTPYCGDWAFSPRDYKELYHHFHKIPEDTNILITHSPPEGILDGSNWGSKALLIYMSRCTNLKLHVFGHIHESYGIKRINNWPNGPSPLFVNAAMAGSKQHAYRNCASKHKPVVFELS